MTHKFHYFALAIICLTILGCSSNGAGSDEETPPFAGMTGYAYFRADYPSIYLNEVSISADGKSYTNLGNYLTNDTPVTSQITAWDSGTISIYNAVYGSGVVSWTVDEYGLVIYVD